MAQGPLHLLCIEPSFPRRLGPVADGLVRRRSYYCQFYHHNVEPTEDWPAAAGNGLNVAPFMDPGALRSAAAYY